jgi:hypothetical protein
MEPSRQDGRDERLHARPVCAYDGSGNETLRRRRWHRVVAAIVALAFSLVIVSMGFVRHAHGVRGHLAPFFGAPASVR